MHSLRRMNLGYEPEVIREIFRAETTKTAAHQVENCWGKEHFGYHDRRSTTELFHRYCTRLERPLSFTTDSVTLTHFIRHIKIYRCPSMRWRICQWLREWRRVYSRWIIAATQRIVYIEPSLMEKTCRESEPVRRSDARDDRSPISEHLRQTTNEHCIYLHCHDVTVQCPLRLLTYLLTHLFIGIYTNVQCPLSGMQRMPSNNFVN